MPMAGKGMLLTSMNIDAKDEAEFNRWYDREHLEERVAIEGFLEARRYVAHDGNPKYLSLYSTETFEVLDSPAYRAALREPLDPAELDGIISMHLIESDPALSKPITDDPSAPNPGAGDWFVLIDATDVGVVPSAMSRFSGNTVLKPLIISSGVYRLMWDLAKSDIGS